MNRYCIQFVQIACGVTCICILVTFASCDILGLCSGGHFSGKQQSNTTGAIALNGYYYESNPENDQATIYMLYANGAFYHFLKEDLQAASAGTIVLRNSQLRLDYKTDWGFYSIDGNTIKIQYWRDGGDCSPVITLRGEISSVNSFNIIRGINKGAKFIFKPYAPKPDSIRSK